MPSLTCPGVGCGSSIWEPWRIVLDLCPGSPQQLCLGDFGRWGVLGAPSDVPLGNQRSPMATRAFALSKKSSSPYACCVPLHLPAAVTSSPCLRLICSWLLSVHSWYLPLQLCMCCSLCLRCCSCISVCRMRPAWLMMSSVTNFYKNGTLPPLSPFPPLHLSALSPSIDYVPNYSALLKKIYLFESLNNRAR